MGKVERPKPVKLLIGFISSDCHSIEKVKDLLIKKFGPENFLVFFTPALNKKEKR